jgi:hypothetical protein
MANSTTSSLVEVKGSREAKAFRLNSSQLVAIRLIDLKTGVCREIDETKSGIGG